MLQDFSTNFSKKWFNFNSLKLQPKKLLFCTHKNQVLFEVASKGSKNIFDTR